MAENEVQNKIKDGVNATDSLIGGGLALASNKVAPVAGPVIVNLLWQHKVKILIVLLCVICFLVFAVESLFVQFSTTSSLAPRGNPIGLERSDLVVKTSGYNLVRVIFGRKHVHKGVDVVPSGQWYAENPGKSSTQAINRAIMPGEVTLFKDQYGALCTYTTNQEYKLLYCHCDSFIAKQGQQVGYGDPICYMGSTGFSTAPHTHIALYERSGNSWQMIDPTPFLFPIKSNGE